MLTHKNNNQTQVLYSNYIFLPCDIYSTSYTYVYKNLQNTLRRDGATISKYHSEWIVHRVPPLLLTLVSSVLGNLVF